MENSPMTLERFFEERNSSSDTIKNYTRIVKLYESCAGNTLNALLEIANIEKNKKRRWRKTDTYRYFVAFKEYLSENYNIIITLVYLNAIMTIYKHFGMNIRPLNIFDVRITTKKYNDFGMLEQDLIDENVNMDKYVQGKSSLSIYWVIKDYIVPYNVDDAKASLRKLCSDDALKKRKLQLTVDENVFQVNNIVVRFSSVNEKLTRVACHNENRYNKAKFVTFSDIRLAEGVKKHFDHLMDDLFRELESMGCRADEKIMFPDGDAGNDDSDIKPRFCTKCGTELKADDRFCFKCGNKINRDFKCSNCGSEMKPDDKFCSQCGTPAS